MGFSSLLMYIKDMYRTYYDIVVVRYVLRYVLNLL
jgi:hypothetical protein